MNQVKSGKFIAEARKEQKLTQRELADKLCISDKTVSKWETGNGLPEISLMLPLCEVLKISVNELLSGEKLDENGYHKKAEENIMNLMREKEEAKKKLILSIIVGSMSILSVTALIIVAGICEMPVIARIALIVIAIIEIIAGISVAVILDREAGVFECPVCKEKFVPEMKAYVMGAHTFTKRYLKCPKCGKSSYCRKRLV